MGINLLKCALIGVLIFTTPTPASELLPSFFTECTAEPILTSVVLELGARRDMHGLHGTHLLAIGISLVARVNS